MDGSADSAQGSTGDDRIEDRVQGLELQIRALTEAVEVLVEGLEGSPMAEPGRHPAEEAARRAHELLLLAKSSAPESEETT
jgi:hypothetical protein